MRILFVASGNKGSLAPFISEQAAALERKGYEIHIFPVQGKGFLGYLKARKGLMDAIARFRPELIHAHYGLCGLLSTLQGKIPVVTTFHGSDINEARVRPFSRLAMRRSAYSIFVSQKLVELLRPSGNYSLLPCGVNLDAFPPLSKEDARRNLGIAPSEKRILFAGAFDNPVKNAALAKEAVALLPETELIELKGFRREEIALQMLAADAMLMTSLTEGSPQVVKEAMAAGCPVVSVDVGDVRERIEGLSACKICGRSPEALAEGLRSALSFNGRTEGRERLISGGFDNSLIADRLVTIYRSCV
ncbi:MAG: glycosyltransferase [Bacteroidales bacterium]|nr:glycosyltransferase [Bacteroidales bacterium]